MSKAEDRISYIEDNVAFLMPAERAYQFAAFAIVQSFVEFYDKKMELAHLLPTENVKFRLHYRLDGIDDETFAFFQSIGLELKTQPESLTRVDMELDFTEQRALEFFAFDRHVCQIYGGLSGVQVNPAPKIRQVKPALMGDIIYIDDVENPIEFLLNAKDDEIACIIGKQSWLTYWSTAMGLPTVELLEPGLKRAWMSKWYSPVYRQLEIDQVSLLPACIRDLAEVVAEIKRREEKAA